MIAAAKWLPSFRVLLCLALISAAPMIVEVSPASAFDCSKASTPTEIAICSDKEALSANDAMEAAFFALRSRLSDAGRQTLIDGQRAWLKSRDGYCEAEAVCLARESETRREQLVNTPDGMAPFFRWQDGGPAEYRVRISGYEFVDGEAPGALTYRWGLDELIRETPLGQPPEPDFDFPRPFEHDLNIRVEMLTPRLLSVVGYTYDYAGGAHPNSWTKAINIDRVSGEPFNLARTLGRITLGELADDCAGQVARIRMEMYGSDDEAAMARQLEQEYPGEVLKHAANIERWHFTPDTAVIQFDSYAIGPYAVGPFSCEFDMDHIRRVARDPSIFDLPQ